MESLMIRSVWGFRNTMHDVIGGWRRLLRFFFVVFLKLKPKQLLYYKRCVHYVPRKRANITQHVPEDLIESTWRE